MRGTPILSIGGSDSTGQSGIQSDIQTIAALGGYALTAITCVSQHAPAPCPLPLAPEVVRSQVESVISSFHPKAVKVGLVTDSETVRLLRDEIIACRKLVIAPGIFDADGRQMVADDVVEAITRHLVPEALLLMLRLRDAEKMLGISIRTDDDMLEAARRLHGMGAKWVLLRGGQHTKGRLTALLSGEGDCFFTSHNIDGWQRHGVAAALSAAITTRLGMGDDVPTAVRNAHDFIHSQVVYAKPDEAGGRAIDIYNSFVSLVAEYYHEAHDVSFYADRLCITTRYLSQVTDRVVGKSPKQIIADYLVSEAKTYLDTSRLGMQEIADRLGFSSQALFCKFFKAQQGTSPSEYRCRS
ncbi:MAG: bifunctional hydroxymethylpyrimidine kinase/phosphomethylpyrimidine kinase [Bacteroidaceae bacterium]|nr:bifunctional hydroxymethylpyrimidine kinase/phosphomethylpyrimidine kinase [Bacteroidaceae bacterium]